MALPASSISPLTRKFQGQLLTGHTTLHLHRRITLSSMQVRMSQVSEPESSKFQSTGVKEKLLEAVPKSVKGFPWKRAENLVVERLASVGLKVLKWSVVVFSIFDFVIGVLFSISKNQELLIPVGLSSGCLLADLFKEVLEEALGDLGEKGREMIFLGITSFFLLMSWSSRYFGLHTRVLLLHAAHGGLLQVWWLWKNSWKEDGDRVSLVPRVLNVLYPCSIRHFCFCRCRGMTWDC